MNIIQTFYDDMATQYDKLFFDWNATTQEQAVILDRIFTGCGFDRSARILDWTGNWRRQGREPKETA